MKKSKLLRRVLTMAMAAAIAAVTLTGCGNKDSETVTEKNDTAGSETTQAGNGGKLLKVGMECAYAPFNWTQETDKVANGDTAVKIYDSSYYAYGYDVMMAKKLAEQMGYDGVEIHKVEWDSIGMGLDSGDYDAIIAGMGKTEEREKAYTFTTPYYYREICITVKKGGKFDKITKLSEFKGMNVKVTTQLGTAWVDLLDQIPDAVLGANYETTAECFMAVQNGVADACVIDLPTSQSAAMTNDDLSILTLDEDDTIEDPTGSTNVCIAVRKDDTDLQTQLQNALDALEWDKDKMDAMMQEAITLQPAAGS
jgi:putative lysine transport system substrate-binding protein